MSNPCEYVPLSQYKWTPGNYIPWPTCPSAYPWNPVIYTIIASFQACTFCICLELTGQVFARFRKKKTLYFWSILIATWGSVIFSVGAILETFTRHILAASVVVNVGWVLFTTSFSLVLYSRLHLLQPSQRVLTTTKWLIIVNSIVFLIPTVVATMLLSSDQKPAWFRVAFIVTKTEIVFTVQEAIIATAYVYLFIRFTKGRRDEPGTKYTLWLLLTSEAFVLIVDIVLNVLLYTEHFLPRQMVQAFTEALKLRIEFIVLNSLVDYSQEKERQERSFGWHGEIGVVPNAGHLSFAVEKPASRIQQSINDVEMGPEDEISQTTS